jgi:hypothetical protein
VEQIAIESRAPENVDTEYEVVRRLRGYLLAVAILLAAGLIWYSTTVGFVWDEGFHLLAAKFISQGRSPYIDFCFPQPPLNAYFNAALFALFGTSWRVTHVFASLFLAASAYLSAEFVLVRFNITGWRWPCVLLAALFTGLNEIVVQFGPIAQAYAISMFCSLIAFRVTVASVGHRTWFLSLLAGMGSGAAAASTLLMAPVAPVLLGWLLIYNKEGSRSKKMAAFVFGNIIPFLPVLALFVKAPRQTFFNVVQYQALFRRVNWGDVNAHDFDVFTAWIDSVPTFLLVFSAAFGLFFVAKKSGWERRQKAEYYLAAALASTLTVYIAAAHPTFQRYFIGAIPFFSIPAAVGFFFVASRLWDAPRPFWPVCLTSSVLLLAAGKMIFDTRDSTTWATYDEISAKIAKVTPPGAQFFADEQVFFLLGKTPMPGMEFSYSHKLNLSPAEEKLYHIVSEKEVNAMVKAGKFATVESCKDDWIDETALSKLFPQQVEIDDCTIFWGPIKQKTK